MNVENHIVSSQGNRPIIYPMQNGLIGAYLMTCEINEKREKDEILIQDFFNIIMKCGISENTLLDFAIRAVKEYKEFISFDNPKHFKFSQKVPSSFGMSILFPSDFNFKKYQEVSRNGDKKMEKIKIKNGIITKNSSYLCKKNLCSEGGIVHHLWMYYGPKVTIDYVSNVHFVSYYFLENVRGFTVGIKDCQLINQIKKNEMIEELNRDYDNILTHYADSPKERDQELSKRMNQVIAEATEITNTDMMGGNMNALKVMNTSGAKGNDVNIAQISILLGLQNINGTMAKKLLANKRRTLPYFNMDDNSKESRGFVISSYLQGLSPTELFIHIAAGRGGIIDTSIKTADTGYMEKKLMKNMEDLAVKYDYTIRDENGNIVSFLFGKFGFDLKKVMFNKKLGEVFFVDPKVVAGIVNAYIYNKNFFIEKKKLSDSQISEILQEIKYNNSNNNPYYLEVAKDAIRQKLKILLEEVELDEEEEAFQMFKEKIVKMFFKSLLDPQTRVGTIAASSMAEPATQLMLSNFHDAGLESKGTTTGIPRLQECLSASKKDKKEKINKNSCHVYFDQSQFHKNKYWKKFTNKKLNREDYVLLAKSLIFTKIENLWKSINLYWIKDKKGKAPEVGEFNIIQYGEYEFPQLVQEGLNIYNEVKEKDFKPTDWVIEIIFNKDKLYEFQVSVEELCELIEEKKQDMLIAIPYIVDSNIKIHIFIDWDKVSGIYENKEITEKWFQIADEDNIKFFISKKISKKFIGQIYVKGIEKINNIIIRKNANKEWYSITEGSNLVKLLNIPGIDKKRTFSDNFWEIYSIFGIEAMRKYMASEMYDVLCHGTSSVNKDHVELLLNLMSRTGLMKSVDRNGLEKENSVNKQITFEQPVDSMAKACLYSKIDLGKNIASTILYGTTNDATTKDCKIIME